MYLKKVSERHTFSSNRHLLPSRVYFEKISIMAACIRQERERTGLLTAIYSTDPQKYMQ